MRRLTGFLQTNVEAYRDTVTHFDTQEPVVALTIDDGLCRSAGDNNSLVKEVGELLGNYEAHATFFVCTEYLKDHQREEALQLLQEGHELGNHLEEDKAFYYNQLSQEEFRHVLQKTNAVLTELDGATHNRWFRAPQGILTNRMHQVITEEGNMRHALGDSYCDDWRFAADVDGENVSAEKRKQVMTHVAELMLSQVQPGSIAILHMPERGFREGGLLALEFFLQGLKARGLKCLSLTEMDQLVCEEKKETIGASPDSPPISTEK